MINNNVGDLPASSCISLEKKYDVFISFRGEDTRYNFTSHLHNALKNNGIDTYIDDRLDRGEEISKALLDAIEASKFCVVVFSKKYASSRWCLDELVHICECMRKKSLVVLPIFYHVDPSDVRRQRKSYEAAFKKNEECFPEDKINKWKDALTTAANHSGWHASNSKNRKDAELVDDIVNFIRGKLDEASSAKQYLVGMEEVILELNKLLSSVTKPQAIRTMAVELLVEPVVSISIDLLRKKIASGVVSFLRGKIDSGFDKLLDSLDTMLLSLAQVLGDAENKQIKNSRVEEWLDRVEDVMEDADNLFEEIEYDALNWKMEMESELDKSEEMKVFSVFKLATQKRKSELEKILDQLVTLEKHRYKLDLRGDVEKIQSLRPPSISFIDHSTFFGRDAERESLKRMLLSDIKVDSENICVIPIVGLGGIGKTTLARAVYDDIEVKEHFEFRAWVCVSDEFEASKVMNKILVAVIKNPCAIEDLSVLLEKIQDNLDKKKFLIVLDDIWNEKYNFWDTIKIPFDVGAKGSKIIVTTRSKIVASTVKTIESLHLDVLKEEFCFELFVKIVSGNKEFTPTNSNLERIGKELVKRCKGLPLAVKAVASLLRVTNVKVWQRIKESDILDSPIGKESILPVLRLSYHYLPSHLKRCFVYCSLFRKDYRFSKDDLISLWIVDNLLEHSSGNRTMKEVGDECFDALVSRSFFQPIYEGIFVMHDLMVDLAIFVSKKKFLYMEKDKTYDIGQMRKIRHIAFQNDINCLTLSEAINVRTLLHFHTLQQDVLNDIMKLGHLRFVSLTYHNNVSELPVSVGELRHLRHLDLSFSSIKELPESVCLLYNLQTLKLIECKHLFKLPENFHHLINLRYVNMSKCRFYTLPPLGQLPALLSLWIEGCDAVTKVGADFFGTSSSQSFPSLESLTFKNMTNWNEWSLPKASVGAFSKLKKLCLDWCSKLEGDLPGLLPCLTELDINYCLTLSSSLPEMPIVTRVQIHRCEMIARFKSCASLQNFDCFECPSLQYNSLQELDVEYISSSLLPLDSFPNIRNVKVYLCHSLESFSLSNTLNSLSTLFIQDCPNFTLPSDTNLRYLLPSLQELTIYRCPELESFPGCGLPFSLRKLAIAYCNKLIASRKKWNLQALPNLTNLYIADYECEDMESFLEQGSLPTSLTHLAITRIACLKTLDEKGFQELKCLKKLSTHECPKLQSLPVKGLPPSFEGLLPPSFETFVMSDCPILEKKYVWETSFWSDMYHILEIRCIIPQSQVPNSQQLLT